MIFDADLRRVVDDVLGTYVSPTDGDAARDGAAPDGAATDGDALWTVLAELGWPLVGVPEDAGGAGGELADAAELAAGIGRHAAPVPLVESGLAAWTLARAGLPLGGPAVRATVAAAEAGQVEVRPADGSSGGGWRLDGTVPAVRWLPAVATVVVVAEVAGVGGANGVGGVAGVDGAGGAGLGSGPVTVVAALDTSAVGVVGARNLADEPVGTLRLDGVTLPPDAVAFAAADLAASVVDRAAVLRSAAIAGAVERACALTKEHVSSRRQFGRPLAALPAVRRLVAGLAVERDLLDVAVTVAVNRQGRGTAAAARVTAAATAGAVATGAHQLHGAMGVTQEYPLHRLTRRLWAWRDEGGTQRLWEQRLGDQVLASDTDDLLWSLVTGAPAPA